MATTELKTLEKLVKDILDKVKKIGEQKPKEEIDSAFDKINEKLETIDERLAAPNTVDNVSAELISKVDELNIKFDERTQNYFNEIQLAFEKFNEKQKDLLLNSEISENQDIKGFVSIITNEMMELKAQFDKFSTEFTDISINTNMTLSKEIVTLKNYALSLNDAVENIKQKVENYNVENEFVTPICDGINSSISNTVEEVFNSALVNFKNDVFGVIAKITDAVQGVSDQITEVAKELKTFEGLELSLGQVIENQQKNKDDILKIIQNNIEDENKKLLPQIMQIVNSVSFDEQAEEIKDGLFAVNENLGIVNKNIETGSKSAEQILAQLEDINDTVKDSKQETSNILKTDLSAKLSKIDEVLQTVSTEFNTITKGTKEGEDSYLYTLLDLESDISKVRIILDELNHSIRDDRSLAENVTKNISDKISNLNSFVEKTTSIYATPDYKELLMQFDALNDDITSISKRTNKLILTSDDASEKLQKNISDFQEILAKICATVKTFENSGVLKALNIRTENMQKLLLNSVQSDKAVNEAFVYLASWIDNTSEEIKKLSEDVNTLKSQNNDIKDIISSSGDNIDEKGDLSSLEKLLKDTNKKLTDNTKRIDSLEQKLENLSDAAELKSMLEFIVAQVQVTNENMTSNKALTKKIDKMEKQLQQLLSYVEED